MMSLVQERVSQKIWLSVYQIAIRFARYCGKMYSRHLCSYDGLIIGFLLHPVTCAVCKYEVLTIHELIPRKSGFVKNLRNCRSLRGLIKVVPLVFFQNHYIRLLIGSFIKREDHEDIDVKDGENGARIASLSYTTILEHLII